MALLTSEGGASVNARNGDGASPLHVAAEHNQPKAAQFLMRNTAFVDSKDSSGRSALEIAQKLKWPMLVRVLQDPTLLFWNRANRGNKLYKAAEYEPACESYELARAEADRMTSPLSNDNIATFYFNYGRSCQLLGKAVQVICHLGPWPNTAQSCTPSLPLSLAQLSPFLPYITPPPRTHALTPPPPDPPPPEPPPPTRSTYFHPDHPLPCRRRLSSSRKSSPPRRTTLARLSAGLSAICRLATTQPSKWTARLYWPAGMSRRERRLARQRQKLGGSSTCRLGRCSASPFAHRPACHHRLRRR